MNYATLWCGAAGEQLYSYKAVGSYNTFVSGCVSNVKCLFRKEGVIVVSAEVMHSMKVAEPNLIPWVVTYKNGKIISCHCTCMAGLAEGCSHVGALLFYLEYQTRKRQDTSCCVGHAGGHRPAFTSVQKDQTETTMNLSPTITLRKQREVDSGRKRKHAVSVTPVESDEESEERLEAIPCKPQVVEMPTLEEEHLALNPQTLVQAYQYAKNIVEETPYDELVKSLVDREWVEEVVSEMKVAPQAALIERVGGLE